MTGRTQIFLGLLGAGLLGQGVTSLLLDALGLANDHLPQRFANSDPLHASIHVIWGAAMIALVLRGLSDTDATKLALIFGVFYTGLAIAGLTIHHPFGMRLDRGENVFHLLVGPASLAVGLASGLRPKGTAGVMLFVVGGLSVLFIGVKLFERRLGKSFVRAGIAFLLVVPLMGVAYAAWALSRDWVAPVDLALFAVLAIVTGLGTSFGYHRLLTHRSFETHAPIKALALIAGAMAVPSRPIDWAARHLEHHAHADHEGDPHSPLDGFLHAHIGWIFAVQPAPRDRYCRRLLADRLVVAVDRTAEFWFLTGLIVPVLIDGWRGLVWGGLVRIAVHNQMMFAVNSVCHSLGSRDFDTKDSSRNNLLVSLFSFGEGWHNNHHAFPSMAIHGIGPGQPDPTGLLIHLLDRVGLIWDVKRPAAELVARRRTMPANTPLPEMDQVTGSV